MNGTLLDLFGVIAASTGLLGAAVSGVLAFLLHRAAGDAERKHAERIRLELERLEGEELQSAVLLALADRVTRSRRRCGRTATTSPKRAIRATNCLAGTR